MIDFHAPEVAGDDFAVGTDDVADGERLFVAEPEEFQYNAPRVVFKGDEKVRAEIIEPLFLEVDDFPLDLGVRSGTQFPHGGNLRFVLIPQRQVQRKVPVTDEAETKKFFRGAHVRS